MARNSAYYLPLSAVVLSMKHVLFFVKITSVGNIVRAAGFSFLTISSLVTAGILLELLTRYGQ